MCVGKRNIVCDPPLIDALLQRNMKEAEGVPIEQLIILDPTLGIKILPHWLAQPYWRPLACTRMWDFPQLMPIWLTIFFQLHSQRWSPLN